MREKSHCETFGEKQTLCKRLAEGRAKSLTVRLLKERSLAAALCRGRGDGHAVAVAGDDRRVRAGRHRRARRGRRFEAEQDIGRGVECACDTAQFIKAWLSSPVLVVRVYGLFEAKLFSERALRRFASQYPQNCCERILDFSFHKIFIQSVLTARLYILYNTRRCAAQQAA